MRSRSFQSTIFLLLAAAILVFCFNAWLAFRSVEALEQSERWVAHSWRVIDSLENVGESLDDAETGTRAYLLSGGDPVYLVPYRKAAKDLPGEFAEVAYLIQDNSEQQGRLRVLRSEIQHRLSLLDQALRKQQAGQSNSADPLVLGSAIPSSAIPGSAILGSAGLAEMNRGRSLILGMEQAEKNLLAKRVSASHSDAQRALFTVLFASIVDLLLILLLLRQTSMERRLREEADRTSDRLQKLQSISEAALARTTSDLAMELLPRVQSAISADTVLLCMRRDGPMVVEAAIGTSIAPGTVIPLTADSPIEQAIDRDLAIMVADTASAPLALEPLRPQMRSLLIAPLSGSHSATGVLLAGRQFKGSFNQHDKEILTVASGRIALALDRAAAYDAERQARKDAEIQAEEVRLLNERLEERVSQRTAELEATNRELEAFSYSVSHDLRAPLRTIDGFSDVLEEDYGGALDAIGQDYLRRIRAGVQRMGQLIDSLLQLSRVTRTELSREPVNLSELARSIAAELTVQNPDRTIHFKIEPGLQCVGDSRLLHTAFENLLGNAVKFTAGEAEARIELGRSQNAYFIRDNGVGFDMRYADKLFSAFNRLHGDREFQGSGIGLATVGRIIRRQQGTIWAESKVGQGATFWFTLGESEPYGRT